MLARNILFGREALSAYSLGLSLDHKISQTYFFHPWKKRLLVGTGEIIVEKSKTECQIPAADLDEIIVRHAPIRA